MAGDAFFWIQFGTGRTLAIIDLWRQDPDDIPNILRNRDFWDLLVMLRSNRLREGFSELRKLILERFQEILPTATEKNLPVLQKGIDETWPERCPDAIELMKARVAELSM